MTFILFDFYPIISRGSTFSDLYEQVITYSLFLPLNSPFIILILALGAYFSTYFFHKRVVCFALFNSVLLSSMVLSLQNHLSGLHVSDAIIHALIKSCFLLTAVLIFFFISVVKRRFQLNIEKNITQRKIESTSFSLQVLMLTLSYSTLMSCFEWTVLIPILTCAIVYGIWFGKKTSRINTYHSVSFKKYDLIFLGSVILFLVLINSVQIGDVVCRIPWFKSCFSCHHHNF